MTTTATTNSSIHVDADRDGIVIWTDAQHDTWDSIVDAVGPAGERAGPSSLMIRVPGWALPTITWWWATEDAVAHPPTVTPTAAARLGSAAVHASRLQDVLATDPADWTWPVAVEGPDGVVHLDDETEFGFSRELRPFQRAQVARLLGGLDGLNFSVPGSGKTTVTYACIGAWVTAGAVTRVVVVAPLSAHEAWEVEAEGCFTDDARPRVSVLPPRPDATVVVVNYEYLQDPDRRRMLRDWLAGAPSVVVFDEAHRAKAGRDGIRGAAALELSAVASRRLVLTGTPAPNAHADLAVMFDLAWPGQGASLVAHPHRTRCFVRATKSDLGLGPMRTLVERVPLSAAHRQLYDACVDVGAAAVNDPAVADDLGRVGRVLMLLLQAATNPAAVLDRDNELRMAGERAGIDLDDLARRAAAEVVPGKFVRLRQIVESNRDDGEKTLVWASFVNHVEQTKRLLDDLGPAVITGAVPRLDPSASTDRVRELDRFRNDDDCWVLIATPQTLGEGVSLHHSCTRQVHIDRTFNAGIYLQSLDRTHRLGLDPGIVATTSLLIADGTIDEVVDRRLADKVDDMAALLDDRDLRVLSLPDEDTTFTATDVLLGEGDAADLQALFAHLHAG